MGVFSISVLWFSVELPPHATMPKNMASVEIRAKSFIFGKDTNNFGFITHIKALLYLIYVKNIHLFGCYENKPYL